MKRRRRDGASWRRDIAPIKGAPFRFRTLHPTTTARAEEVDRSRRGDSIPRPPFTLDRVVIVTLAAIPGLEHSAEPTVEVRW